jgi:hypothetical protein
MTDDLAVRTAGLVKSYGGVRVLDGVDLRVDRGSVFALLGTERRRQDDDGAHPVHIGARRTPAPPPWPATTSWPTGTTSGGASA